MDLKIAIGFGLYKFKIKIQLFVKRFKGGFDEIQALLIEGLRL